MVDNFVEHFTKQPVVAFFLIVFLLLALYSIYYFVGQNKKYGSLNFASSFMKFISAVSVLGVVILAIYTISPYVNAPSNSIAIVLGNTQNTPKPNITKDVSDSIEATMLQHKGETGEEISDSLVFISAVGTPEVLDNDALGIKLRDIGNNTSNARRSAKQNIEMIQKALEVAVPVSNGANYLEAIFEARDNLEEGSNIVVVGSGLSDTGDLNFSLTNILRNEESRKEAIKAIEKKYGSDALRGYAVEFYGLGDTVAPQEPLATLQKSIVRDTYKDTIRSLGGTVTVHTDTQTGPSVETDHVVGTTDTGCGVIGLVFNDDNLKFTSNRATFVDPAGAKETLATIKTLWDQYSDTIESLKVDGYIAHYGGGIDTLSQPRADAVRSVLLDLGIPANKVSAEGKGYGPYEQDTQNRMVKVTIVRNSAICGNQ